MTLLLLLLGGGAAVAAYVIGRQDGASVREDIEPETELDLGDAVGEWSDIGDVVAESAGWPYAWAEGSPSTPWEDGANGVDCSGYVQMALVRLGYLSSGATDRSAHSLANDSDPVALGDQQPGDMAYYPGHVMLVAGPPGEDGHCPVVGASGGDSGTHGDDPDAYVKLFSTGLYRGDFVTYMRLKA